MDRINRIISHPLWLEEMKYIEDIEKNRVFCGHGTGHLLDVARIAYIFCLEEGINISRELIYGAALIHDIGRGKEYRDGTPHEKAGAEIGEIILKDSGFSAAEREEITEAVLSHRRNYGENRQTLGAVLYMADKKSRCCFMCSAEKECNWKEELKNKTIER